MKPFVNHIEKILENPKVKIDLKNASLYSIHSQQGVPQEDHLVIKRSAVGITPFAELVGHVLRSNSFTKQKGVFQSGLITMANHNESNIRLTISEKEIKFILIPSITEHRKIVEALKKRYGL
ncbi:MAG: hypothetical protein ABH803_03590 [Candidatus Micrarchaeota archaeon]